MTSTYKSKRDTESNGLYKLLSQTDIQVIKNSLFTKSTTQKEKKMKIETEERGEFSIDNQEHFERKQNPLLRSKSLSHYKNRCIRLHDKSNSLTRRRVNNVHVKNHELNRTKL